MLIYNKEDVVIPVKGSLLEVPIVHYRQNRSLSAESFIIERFNLSLSDWEWLTRLMAATTEHESIGKEDYIAAVGSFKDLWVGVLSAEE